MSVSTVTSPARVRPEALIGGEWVTGSKGTFDVVSPYDKSVISISRCGPDEVSQAVAAARAAQPGWAATSLLDRVDILRRMHALFLENGERIAQAITRDIGKTITETREEVYEYAAPSYHRAAEEALRFRGMSLPSTQERTNNKRLHLTRRPLGVVGVIAPYNFPTDISSIALAPALITGNTVVWKPSEYAAAACALVAELFEEAGFPPGVVNVVNGFGDVGSAIVNHEDVDGIAFTGSSVVGEQISHEVGLKRALLELGGDGPMIVLEDADVDSAVEGAIVGCFYLAGQVCTSSERILVHEDVHDEFVRKFIERTATLKVGDPFDEATEMGPLCNEKTLTRVIEQVDDAIAKGAKVFQHGERDGLFFPPTILTEVSEDMLVAQRETFGPVASIIRFASEEEALKIAKKSKLALIASVYTRDLSTAWRVAEALPHGSVNINETSNYWDQQAPFGGAGGSGQGRELGIWGLEAFTESKLLVFDIGQTGTAQRRAEGGW